MTENNGTPDIIVFDFDYLFNMLHKYDKYYYKLSTLLYQYYRYKKETHLKSITNSVISTIETTSKVNYMFFRSSLEDYCDDGSDRCDKDMNYILKEFTQILLDFKKQNKIVYFLCIGDYRAAKNYFKLKKWFTIDNESLVKYIGTDFKPGICGRTYMKTDIMLSVGDTHQVSNREHILASYKYYFIRMLNEHYKNHNIQYYGFMRDCGVIKHNLQSRYITYYSNANISNIIDSRDPAKASDLIKTNNIMFTSILTTYNISNKITNFPNQTNHPLTTYKRRFETTKHNIPGDSRKWFDESMNSIRTAIIPLQDDDISKLIKKNPNTTSPVDNISKINEAIIKIASALLNSSK